MIAGVVVYGGEMNLNGKNVCPALLITLGVPKKCYREKFYFDGFLEPIRLDSDSRIKKNVNSTLNANPLLEQI